MMYDILLTSAIPLLLLITALYGSKQDVSGTFFFSKEYTRTLKGLCAIVVMMVHVPEQFGNPLQDAIGSAAYVAVTCFFLMSAYGMHYSLAHKDGYLTSFWRNRLVSLLVPQLLVNVILVLSVGGLFIFHLSADAPHLYDLLHLDSYVLLLLLYCLVFYLSAYLFRNKGEKGNCFRDVIIISAVAVSSLLAYFIAHGEGVMAVSGWPYERIGLIWGILLFLFFPFVTKWLQNRRLLKSAVVAVLCIILGFIYLKCKEVYFWGEYLLKVVLGAALITFLFLISGKRTFSNRLSRFFGDISYEIFLLHTVVYLVVSTVFPDLASGWFILLSFSTTVLLGYLIHIIAKRIIALLRK